MKKIITFGTFDLFHIGHYNILKRAKELGNYLIVGVSSDELSLKKGKKTIWDLQKRITHIKNSGFADEVFIEDSLEKKKEYVTTYSADILVMGDDWKGAFDWIGIPCVYLERTKNISTTQTKIIDAVNNKNFIFYFDIQQECSNKYILIYYFNMVGIKYYDTDIDTVTFLSDSYIILFNSSIKNNKTYSIPVIVIDDTPFDDPANLYPYGNYYLVSGIDRKKSLEYYYDGQFITTGYIKTIKTNSDIVISNNNYILAESLAAGKKTIHITDSIPLVSGINKYNIFGIPCQQENTTNLISDINKFKSDYEYIYNLFFFNLNRGYYIADDSCEKITKELIKIDNNINILTKKSVIPENFINKHYIAHAGGIINNTEYTNSLEAITNSINLGYEYIELDIVKLLDGYAIAHDGYELYYGFRKKFPFITVEEFKQSKFNKKYTPLILEDLKNFNGIKFILDIKEIDNEYKNFIDIIKDYDCFIPQVYDIEEYQYLEKVGVKYCIFALWKKNYHIKKKILDELKYICYGSVQVLGITAPYISWYKKPWIYGLQSFGKIVYLHHFGNIDPESLVRDSFGVII